MTDTPRLTAADAWEIRLCGSMHGETAARIRLAIDAIATGTHVVVPAADARDAARWNWFLGQLHSGFWKAAEWETTDRYGDGRWNEATEPDEFLQMIGNEPEAAAALAAAEGAKP